MEGWQSLARVASSATAWDWLLPFFLLVVLSSLAALYYERRKLAILQSSAAYAAASISFELANSKQYLSTPHEQQPVGPDDGDVLESIKDKETSHKAMNLCTSGVEKLQLALNALCESDPDPNGTLAARSIMTDHGGFERRPTEDATPLAQMNSCESTCGGVPDVSLDLLALVSKVQEEAGGKAVFSRYQQQKDTYLVSVKVRGHPETCGLPAAAEVLSVLTMDALHDVGFLGRHGLLVGQPAVVQGCIQLLLQVQTSQLQGPRHSVHVDLPYLKLDSAGEARERLQQALEVQLRSDGPSQYNVALLPVTATAQQPGDLHGAAPLEVLMSGAGVCGLAGTRVRLVVCQEGVVLCEAEVTPSVVAPDTVALVLEQERLGLALGLAWVYVLPLRHSPGAAVPLGSAPLLVLTPSSGWELQRYFDDVLVAEGQRHALRQTEQGDALKFSRHGLMVSSYSSGFREFAIAMGQCLQGTAPALAMHKVLLLLLRAHMWECGALVVRHLVAAGVPVHGLTPEAAQSLTGMQLQRLTATPATRSSLPRRAPRGPPSLLRLLLLPLTGFPAPEVEQQYISAQVGRTDAFITHLLLFMSVCTSALLLCACLQLVGPPGFPLLEKAAVAAPLLPCLWRLHASLAGAPRRHLGLAMLAAIAEVLVVLNFVALPYGLHLEGLVGSAATRAVRALMLALSSGLSLQHQLGMAALQLLALTLALLDEEPADARVAATWSLGSLAGIVALCYCGGLRQRLAFINQQDVAGAGSGVVAGAGAVPAPPVRSPSPLQRWASGRLRRWLGHVKGASTAWAGAAALATTRIAAEMSALLRAAALGVLRSGGASTHAPLALRPGGASKVPLQRRNLFLTPLLGFMDPHQEYRFALRKAGMLGRWDTLILLWTMLASGARVQALAMMRRDMPRALLWWHCGALCTGTGMLLMLLLCPTHTYVRWRQAVLVMCQVAMAFSCMAAALTTGLGGLQASGNCICTSPPFVSLRHTAWQVLFPIALQMQLWAMLALNLLQAVPMLLYCKQGPGVFLPALGGAPFVYLIELCDRALFLRRCATCT